ncbi:hypothetical protein BHM03_00039950 [Ensete ventricosum]|nr:hypothetical protein BHM03_00039950 [Ensete ventricosum]
MHIVASDRLTLIFFSCTASFFFFFTESGFSLPLSSSSSRLMKLQLAVVCCSIPSLAITPIHTPTKPDISPSSFQNAFASRTAGFCEMEQSTVELYIERDEKKRRRNTEEDSRKRGVVTHGFGSGPTSRSSLLIHFVAE